MIRPFYLTPVECELRTPELIPFIERLIAKFPEGSYTLGGVLNKFFKGEWTAWVGAEDKDSEWQGLMGTAAFPNMQGTPVLQIMFLVSSNPNLLMDIMEELEYMVADRGIRKIEILGRKGWKPYLAKRGYESKLVCYQKTLPEPLAEMEPKGVA